VEVLLDWRYFVLDPARWAAFQAALVRRRVRVCVWRSSCKRRAFSSARTPVS